MRDLSFEDMFTISKIIKKMNIKNEIKVLIMDAKKDKKADGENAAQSLGIDVALIFVENIGSAEREVYQLFASLIEKKVEEVKKMKATEVFEIVKGLFENEDAKKVFSMALK